MDSSRRSVGVLFLVAGAAVGACGAPANLRANADAMLRHDVDARGPGVAVLVARGDEVVYRVKVKSPDYLRLTRQMALCKAAASIGFVK